MAIPEAEITAVQFLVDRTARSMICSWHDTVICSSVRLPVPRTLRIAALRVGVGVVLSCSQQDTSFSLV